ncbi:MAG TPA: acyl-CoA dehydrogenase family protein [Acidimicrobiia bacterium]
MDFSFTPDQELLRDTARALLGNECPPSLLRAHMTDRTATDPLWNHLRDFAALGTGDATDLCVFVEQTGYVSAPGPFFASVALCAPLLDAIGHPALDAMAAGEATGTVAVAGRAGEWAPNAEPVKYFVPDADLANVIVVVEPGPSVRVITAPAAAAPREIATVDSTRRVFRVDLSAEPAGESFPLSLDAWIAWRDRAHVALAAEMVGTARRLFDMALAYAKERKQFDTPIGSFQAIQHKLADLALALERATAAVQYASMTVDAADADRTRACHVAKAAAGDAARRCLKDGIQIHGGIGYTWEHDLHLFIRRATASEYLLGPTSWHHDRLADLLFA